MDLNKKQKQASVNRPKSYRNYLRDVDAPISEATVRSREASTLKRLDDEASLDTSQIFQHQLTPTRVLFRLVILNEHSYIHH